MLAALLTDFGLDDPYVGVMKAVLLGLCPGASIVDLTHAIPPQDILAGALALEDAAPFLPEAAVICAVVDPGVGSSRAAIAARSGGRLWVGPDNGLLSWQLGADAAVVQLQNPRYRLPAISATFHGRDVFAPAAAHLLRDVPLEELGPPASTWVQLPRPTPTRRADGTLEAHVVAVDRFGNLVLDARAADLPARPTLRIGDLQVDGLARTYAEPAPNRVCALIGSFGRLEVALPNGNAAAHLGIGKGSVVLIRPG